MFRTQPLTLALIFTALALTGCGDDPAGKEPGGCGFAGGGKGAPAVTAGAAVTLDTREDKTQSNPDYDSKVQLAQPGRHTLAHGPCGAAGLLIWTRPKGDTQLGFVDPKKGGAPEVVVAKVGSTTRAASLFFDAACKAVVLRGSTSEGYAQYTRSSPGTWDKAAALADLSSVMGGKVSSLSLVAAHTDAAGKMHVFSHASAGSDKALLHGSRDATAGSAWTFTKHPRPTATDIYTYRAGPGGTLYTLYKNTKFPCDPCNMDFYIGTLAKGAKAWAQQTVRAGKWGDPDDEFLASGTLAFDGSGNPFIAAHFQRRVVTGSFKDTGLVLYGQTGSGWCAESLASKNAGYVGGDGDSFTGNGADLAVGPGGRLFVLFRDQAVWHAGGQQNEMIGNPRLAAGSGDSWSVTTLLGQKGQSSSPKPLYGCVNPQYSLSADGKEVVMACVEAAWDTSSIYNTSDAKVTYTVKAVTVAVK